MKKLSIEKLERITGGDFITGFCGGVAVVRYGAALGLFAINPVVGGVMLGVVGGCILYGGYKALS